MPLISEGGSLSGAITNSGAHLFDVSSCPRPTTSLQRDDLGENEKLVCLSFLICTMGVNPASWARQLAMASGPCQSPLCDKECVCTHVSRPSPGGDVPDAKGWTLGSCRLPFSAPKHLGDHNCLTPFPLSLSPMRSSTPASGLSSSHARGLGRCPGAHGLGPPGSAAPRTAPVSAIPRQTSRNSGSYMILMRDDAWRAYVLWQHQGSWGAGRGSSGSWSLPPPGFLSPPGTDEHSGSPLGSQAQCSLASGTLPPSRPQFIHLYPWGPGGLASLASIICSRASGGGSDSNERSPRLVSVLDPLHSFSRTLASCPSVTKPTARATKGSFSLRCLGGEKSLQLGCEGAASRTGSGGECGKEQLQEGESASLLLSHGLNRTRESPEGLWTGAEEGGRPRDNREWPAQFLGGEDGHPGEGVQGAVADT